jgi:2-oxoglutarate ferredoxin oxidoreductase subunit alpha
VDSLPSIDPNFALGPNAGQEFLPYLRDERLARPWAVPGTPGLRHRIGGLEKEDGTGDISYDPQNHERMTELRSAKVDRIAADIPALEVTDPDGGAEILVLGWGSTYGTIEASARRVREQGRSVATAHLTHLNPFPANLGEVLARFERVLVPELNMGQLVKLLRAEFLVPAESLCKVQGQPFKIVEIRERIEKLLAGEA